MAIEGRLRNNLPEFELGDRAHSEFVDDRFDQFLQIMDACDVNVSECMQYQSQIMDLSVIRFYPRIGRRYPFEADEIEMGDYDQIVIVFPNQCDSQCVPHEL